MGDAPNRIMIGMPMFNEEETVGTIVQLSRRHADEVVCIDDGSSDHSARIAEAAGATVIRHRTNLGYGAALKSLFNKARADDVDVLIILDSDGQHDPNDVPRIIAPILADEADLVIGSRFHQHGGSVAMPAYRRLGNKIISMASNMTSDHNLRDTQSGFRAFSKKALSILRFEHNGMELSLEILDDAQEKQLHMKEVPTIIRYDVPKGSQYTAVSHGFSVLGYAFLTLSQKKPLLVLGLPGLGLVGTSISMGMDVIQKVTERADGIVGEGMSAVFIGILGLTMCATGLVLQSARTLLRHLVAKRFGITP